MDRQRPPLQVRFWNRILNIIGDILFVYPLYLSPRYRGLLISTRRCRHCCAVCGRRIDDYTDCIMTGMGKEKKGKRGRGRHGLYAYHRQCFSAANPWYNEVPDVELPPDYEMF